MASGASVATRPSKPRIARFGEVQVAPPDDVGDVAERTDHRDAAALVGLGEVVREDRHLDTEDGSRHGAAEQRLVALVVGVGDEGHTGREQFGSCGLDLDRSAVGLVERDAVVGGGLVAVLELGLGDGSAEGHVPEGGCHGLVGLTTLDVAEERELRGEQRLGADGAVGLSPVHREPERAPQFLELHLVLGRQALAQLDEVAPADGLLVGGLGALAVAALERRHKVGRVGQRRIAPHAVVVLHASLGGQPVVIPAHRIEHAPTAHALEAGDDIRVGVGEDVADVQRSRCGGRGSVDRVDALAGGARSVEAVGALRLPGLAPLGLEALEGRLVGDVGRLGARHDAAPIDMCGTESMVRCLSMRGASLPGAAGEGVYAECTGAGAASGLEDWGALRIRSAARAETSVIAESTASTMSGCHHA